MGTRVSARSIRRAGTPAPRLFCGNRQDHGGALLVADHDIRLSVAVKISGGDLRADARGVFNEVRDETGFSIGGAAKEKGVEHGCAERIDVALRAVGPPTFAGKKIEEAVTIEVGERHGVRLRELNAGNLFIALGRGDDVGSERDRAVRAARLLEPTDAVAMRVDGGDHVGEVVAVDVVSKHLRSAAGVRGGAGEGKFVQLPDGIAGERRGLFPPAILFEDVVATVAVDVAEAQTVRVTLPGSGRRNRMKGPRPHG